MGVESSRYATQKVSRMEDYDFKYNYNQHVRSALADVKGGQHLRFINGLYLTKEVCLEAVKYECGHNPYNGNDINWVPAAIIDDVIEEMKKMKYVPIIRTSDKTEDRPEFNEECIKYLEKVAARRKEAASKPGYYGDEFKSYQDLLDYYKAKDHEEMLYNKFVGVIKRENGWDKEETPSPISEEQSQVVSDKEEVKVASGEEVKIEETTSIVPPEAKENKELEQELNKEASVLEVKEGVKEIDLDPYPLL